MNTIIELQQLIRYIEEDYAGDYASISQDLSRVIYQLHYLEEEMTNRPEVQDLCHALQKLSECFHHAHSAKRRHQPNKPP